MHVLGLHITNRTIGRDCIGCAKTGSGKTAAFALPILNRLSDDPYGIFALVITPTRFIPIYLALSLSLCLSQSLSLSLALSLSLFRSLALSLSLCLSVFLSHSFSLLPHLFLSLTCSLLHSLSLCLCLSVTLFLSLSISASLSRSAIHKKQPIRTRDSRFSSNQSHCRIHDFVLLFTVLRMIDSSIHLVHY